jgi:hydroxymethylpyrimidine/phosphomethylpyrimidine kinase
MTIPIGLTIAGSDSSGGAGIQADLKTFSALGVYGASVVTALTAQNTLGVTAIHDPPPEFIGEQIDAVFDDLAIAAVKIGMLSRVEVIEIVAGRLAARGAAVATAPRTSAAGSSAPPIVLDPVMIAKSGAVLLQGDAVAALRARLLPMARIVTPNIPEAAALTGLSERDVTSAPERACEQLAALGAQAVVLKGGHAGGATSDDLFYDGRTFARLSAPRIATKNTHGTGCTFSSAIAANLAKGMGAEDAVRAAKAYITRAIEAGAALRIGGGHGPVHHFHASWRRE